MKVLDKLYQYEKLIQLISCAKTGNADKLASKIGISRSQLFLMLDELKSQGIEIEFNRKLDSFTFDGTKRIRFKSPIEFYDLPHPHEIVGGYAPNYTPFFFLDSASIYL